MKLKINGKEQIVKAGSSLAALIEEKNLELKKIVIELNGEIVNKEKIETIILKDQDSIEIVSFVQGG